MNKKLTRSTNKMLAGVCGGIAEYFNLDPTIVRVGYAFLSIFSAGFPGILLYLVMWLVMPEKTE
jgi:phage shock protein C